jgi:hypothetical protein
MTRAEILHPHRNHHPRSFRQDRPQAPARRDHRRYLALRRPGRGQPGYGRDHLRLEEAFDVEIPDDAAENILTVGQAVDWLEKTLGVQVAA